MIVEALQRRADQLEDFGFSELEGRAPTPVDYAVWWIEGGKTILQLAQAVSEDLGFEVPRQAVSRILNESEGPEGARRIATARVAGSHSVAESTLTTVDSSGRTREDIQHARLKADAQRWLAGAWNRDEYGTSSKAQVTVNITSGSALLDMIRVREVETPELPREAEYELLEAETS